MTIPALRPVDLISDLDYSRTVDRTVVHRESLAEVFVTDTRRIDENSYAAAAHLPRSHAYYGDHLLRPATYDPILLLEACRQAALAGAHLHYGVPFDHKFILTHLRVSLDRPPVVGASPCSLGLFVTITDRRLRDGQVTGLDYELELIADGGRIGRAAVGLRFRSPESYHALRLKNRDGAALPSTADLAATTGTQVAPHLVGRANPDNTLLMNGRTSENGVQSILRVPAEHPSLFDHPQDHLPGMVLAEAIRQLALYTALDVLGTSTAKTIASGLSITFTSFGELEPETELRSTVGRNSVAPEQSLTLAGLLEPEESQARVPMNIDVRQLGKSIAEATVELTRV